MHGVGPALVIAGPGSGKTFVITHRILYLIENLSISPDKILVITFTKAAALQMKERTDKMSFHKYSTINFGTFHALFFKILIKEGIYTPDSIIKDSEKIKIVAFLSQKYDLKSDSANQLYTHILNDISRYKSFIFTLENSNTEEFHPLSTNLDTFIQIYKDYSKELELNNKLDFDDMQLKAYDLLANNERIRQKYKSQYEYIMIDEFQDINPLQMRIVSLLLNDKKNLFVVGDDDQSIYSFRGSEPGIMLNFFSEYSNAKKIVLNTNYRSAKAIVNKAGRVIENNNNRYKKNIHAFSQEMGEVSVIEKSNLAEECLYIKDIIEKYKDDINQIAIITRTNRFADFYAQFLADNGIKFAIKERIRDIYSNFAVADIISYLKIATGDNSRGTFLNIINRPERGIYRGMLKEVVSLDGMIALTSNAEIKKYLFALKKDIAFIGKLSPFVAIHYIVNKMHYGDFLKEFCKKRGYDYEKINEDIADISNRAKGYETIKAYLKSVEEYKKELELSKDAAATYAKSDGVNICTMHGSKGLEYKYVIIPDVIEGNIPPKSNSGGDCTEEERRLFYVAMTRAKDELHILYPKYYLDKEAIKSRYIDEFE